MFPEKTSLQVAILESHAAQLRQSALEFLFSKGEEYTNCLDEVIAGIRDEDSEHKRILGLLAEIGFVDVFCQAVQCSLDNPEENQSCS